ncbi:MAG: hypothetical protein ACO3FI_10180 [Cyclobacteriaceae bacterium]
MLLISSTAGWSQATKVIKKDTYWSNTQKYSFGFRLGPTITIGSITSKEDREILSTLPKTGFTASGILTMPLQKDFSFAAELGYQRGGRKMKINESGWITDYDYNFLTSAMALRKTIPVNLREDLKGEIYFGAGPAVSWFVGPGKGKITTPNGGVSKFTVEYNNYDPDAWGDFNRYFINDPNRLLFGLDLSMGGDAPINMKQKLYGEVRFTWGHTNLGTRQTDTHLNILNFEDTMFVNLKTISFSLIYTYGFETRKSKKGKSTLKRKPQGRR